MYNRINKTSAKYFFLMFFTFLLLFVCNDRKEKKIDKENPEWYRLVKLGDNLSITNKDSSTILYNLALGLNNISLQQKIDVLIKLSQLHILPFSSLSIKTAYDAVTLSDSLNDNKRLAQSYYFLSKAYYGSYNYDSTIKYSKICEQIASENNYNHIEIQCYNLLSQLYVNIGEYELAINYGIKGLNEARTLDDSSSIAFSNVWIGYAYGALGNNYQSLNYYYQSIKSPKYLTPYTLSWVYYSIADCYTRINENENAIEFLKKSEETIKKHGLKSSEVEVTTNLGYSYAYYAINKPDSSLKYAENALKIAKDLSLKSLLINSYNQIGMAQVSLNRFNEALNSYHIALEQTNINDANYQTNTILANISEAYAKSGNYKKSIELAEKTLLDENLETKQISYYNLSLSYENLNNTPKALKYYKLYAQVKDSLLNIEKSNQIKNLEFKYKTEQKQKHIELQQTQLENQDLQLKKQRTALYSSAAILGLFLGIIGLVILNVKKKKEQQKLLSIKNNELQQQNEEILAQRDEIESQKDIIELKSKEVNDSITYARFIQKSILPSEKEVSQCFKNYFVLYLPKDLVSGDFYWTQQINGLSLCAVSDCTGHGVPGGFMSMLGIAFLNEIHAKNPHSSPAERLGMLKQMVIKTLKQDSNEVVSKDGMDISIFSIDYENLKLNYGSALGKIILVRNNTPKLLEYERNTVGFSYSKNNEFKNFTVQLQEGDLIYAFTDGIVDQLGCKENKKYSTKRFSERLCEISKFEFDQHKVLIENEFNQWKGNFEQLDDILVFGIKI